MHCWVSELLYPVNGIVERKDGSGHGLRSHASRAQVIRSNRFMADVATTVANDIPPHDVSCSEHHIHTIMDDGEFTVIKIKKNLHTASDTRYEHLRDAVVDFLQGECTIVDLSETLKETEGDE